MAKNRAARSATEMSLTTLVEVLRKETTGGRLLLIATAVALVWANLLGTSYRAFWSTPVAVGPDWLHLNLSLASWVSDGLLAVFFFVAGLEIKRELTVGVLVGWRSAALPLAAALGGMILPALVAIVASGGTMLHGGAWAIPVSTDIAFALAMLALAGSALPSGVRVLLLSMAVIDDLGGIGIVGVLFTHDAHLGWLAYGVLLCIMYGYLQYCRWNPGWLLALIAVAAWVCVHAGGIHPTVTGIFLGLLTPVRTVGDEKKSLCERLEHTLYPYSAGLVVPLFALAAAGIPLAAAGAALTDPVAYGIVAGLLVGKTLGILGGIWLAIRTGVGALPDQVSWADLLPVAVLGGIGYTVSLLIARLSLPDGSADRAAAAVLGASALASTVAVVLLRRRVRLRNVNGPAGVGRHRRVRGPTLDVDRVRWPTFDVDRVRWPTFDVDRVRWPTLDADAGVPWTATGFGATRWPVLSPDPRPPPRQGSRSGRSATARS